MLDDFYSPEKMSPMLFISKAMFYENQPNPVKLILVQLNAEYQPCRRYHQIADPPAPLRDYLYLSLSAECYSMYLCNLHTGYICHFFPLRGFCRI